MSVAGLESVFRPKSIAVVGASDRAGSRGAEMLRNLESIGYSGEVFAVNPNRAAVGGVRCFPRLSDIPATVETVAICVGRQGALAAIEESLARNVSAIVILGSGYAELGEEVDRDAQASLADRCRTAGVTLVGPNCLGMWSRLDKVSYWLAPGSAMPFSGIGLVAQSGALASSVMEPLADRHVVLDCVGTTGNEGGITAADVSAYFAEDDRVQVIGLILESIRRPGELLKALSRARSLHKPVVCLLLGMSEKGKSAAVAHTAALVGDGAVARAFLEDAGVLLVDDLAELNEHLVLFSRYPRGLADGLAVLTVSGGGSGLVADLASKWEVQLAELLPETRERIGSALGGRAVENPIDVALAGDEPGLYEKCLAIAADDPNVGTVAVALNVAHAADSEGSAFYAMQMEAGKASVSAGRDTVAFSFVSGDPDAAVLAAGDALGIPLLMGCREALRGIGNALKYRAALSATPEMDEGSLQESLRPKQPSRFAGRVLGSEDPTDWDDVSVRRALAAYGVPVVPERLTHSVLEASRAARELGYPVALKVVAPQLSHKTDRGAVRLNVSGPAALRQAFTELMRTVTGEGDVQIRGISVQAMVPMGTELLLACRRDAVFGRAIVVGWGGLWVESFSLPQVAPLPLSEMAARRMIERLFGPAGDRARRVADLAGLQEAVVAFAEFARHLPESVDVVEVNPLILGVGVSGGVLAVDAAVRRSREAHQSEEPVA